MVVFDGVPRAGHGCGESAFAECGRISTQHGQPIDYQLSGEGAGVSFVSVGRRAQDHQFDTVARLIVALCFYFFQQVYFLCRVKIYFLAAINEIIFIEVF